MHDPGPAMGPVPPSPFTPTAPFRPARGLEGPHAQTICGDLLRPTRTPPLSRERWDTPDGDFLDVDILEAAPEAPWVLALHGLEGSSRTGYMATILRGARARGWGAVALNFRSCSGEPNRLLRSYSSGDTDDPCFVLERMRERVSGPIFSVGFSLGANVLVRVLARGGEGSPLRAGAAVSVPYDLGACARAIDASGGWNRVYRSLFMRSIRRKALAKARAHPGALDLRAIREARGLEAFDDAVIAPIYGFKGARDYYAHCSSGPVLGRIRRPTLLLNSADDPMIPSAVIPRDDNPWLSWLITERGGHVGFVAGTPWRPRFWAEEQVLEFFFRHL